MRRSFRFERSQQPYLSQSHQTPRYGVPFLLLTGLCIVCLTPFLDKAFHIDDPLFLWTAQHIQSDPLNFYGFTINWYFTSMPMHEIAQNPPLASYYAAAAGFLFGWSETALHIAFLLPAIAAAMGTYYTSALFCTRPLAAALAGILTPAFLVSATSIMCDVMMLAFWTWAIYWWVQGIRSGSNRYLLTAASLIALASLTKYFGLSLIPLLLVYSVLHERRAGAWLLFLAAPLVVIFAYQAMTYHLYGAALLSNAANYAYVTSSSAHSIDRLSRKLLTGLAFVGFGFASVLCYAFSLVSPRRLFVIAAGILLSIMLYRAFMPDMLIGSTFQTGPDISPLFLFQNILAVVTGIGFLLLAAIDLGRKRDAETVLLFLWITGTFFFTVFLNWTVSMRNLLPLLPAVGILLVRRFEHSMPAAASSRIGLLAPLLPAAVLALSVSWADYQLADTSRRMAQELTARYSTSRTIWFQGHWGFQYYMEAQGAKPLDLKQWTVASNDILIVPATNSGAYALPDELLAVAETVTVQPSRYLSTMNRRAGAGFYSDVFGSLPYVFGSIEEETYTVYRLRAEPSAQR